MYRKLIGKSPAWTNVLIFLTWLGQTVMTITTDQFPTTVAQTRQPSVPQSSAAEKVVANNITESKGDFYNERFVEKRTPAFEVTAHPHSLNTTGYFLVGAAGEYSDECYGEATEYVYGENLCYAPDPDKYLLAAKSRYSCAGRCGERPKLTRHYYTCACDERCVLYGDCCKDISIACPDISPKGKIKYGHLFASETFCSSSQFLLFLNCKPPTDHFSTHALTGIWSTIKPPRNTRDLSERKPAPFESRTLKQFIGGFYSFTVTDLSFGVTFSNMVSFRSCAVPASRPILMPLIATLLCEVGHLPPSLSPIRSVNHLQWCAPVTTGSAHPPDSRVCPQYQYISCQCADGEVLHDRVHNACVGRNSSTSPLILHDMWNYHLQTLIKPASNEPCQISLVDEFGFVQSRSAQSSGTKFILKMKVSPVLSKKHEISGRVLAEVNHEDVETPTAWQENLDVQKEDNGLDIREQDRRQEIRKTNMEQHISRQNTEQDINKKDKEQDINKKDTEQDIHKKDTEQDIHKKDTERDIHEQDVEFIVEIENSLERRLYCSDLKSPLLRCRLEECAPGGLLLHESGDWAAPFHGRSCVVPTSASVRVSATQLAAPRCTCLHIVALLARLQVWKVGNRTVDDGQCSAMLTTLPTESAFIHSDSLLRIEEMSPKKRLLSLISWDGAACADDIVPENTVELCFYTQETPHGADRAEPVLCWDLSTEPRNPTFRGDVAPKSKPTRTRATVSPGESAAPEQLAKTGGLLLVWVLGVYLLQ